MESALWELEVTSQSGDFIEYRRPSWIEHMRAVMLDFWLAMEQSKTWK